MIDRKFREPAVRTIAMPADTNPSGDIFGGWLLSQMDLAGSAVARLRARGRVVTVAIDRMTFHRPVYVGDTGDYLVRNLIGVDAERGLLVIGEKVSNGDKIMFVRRDEQAASEDMVHMLSQLRKRIDGPPQAGVYIACVGRGPAIFSPGNREIDIIHDSLGRFPLVGFSANGEICNNRLYGYTGVLLLFL